MVQKLENEVSDVPNGKNPPSPKSRLAVLKRSKKAPVTSDPFRFQGQGITYKGKLIGEKDVDQPRGDSMCAEAMRISKAAIKAAGTHKTRIIIQINIEGIKLIDEKSNAVMHNFPVSRISFIARDTTDSRAFGLVFGEGTGSYKFYGIKTAQTADHTVLAIRDMFQVVFEMKKKQIEQVKQQQDDSTSAPSAPGVAVADLLDLETELHNIEQGVQQLQQIPTTIDAFGSTPFADPFNEPSNHSNSMTCQSFNNLNISGGSIPHNSSLPNSFNDFTARPTMGMAWPQNSSPPQTMCQQQQQQVPSLQQPYLNQHVAPVSFSETNPFASTASFPSDPFSPPFVHAPQAPPPVPTSQPTYQNTIDWGVNENAQPNGNNGFANFESKTTEHRWEEPKRVTSLEEAFTKLVDMNSIVGPQETKKNPFDHILNPPKASLNSLVIPPRPVASVVPSSADPFGDDFFR